MITIVAAFTKKNEERARKIFGAGDEEYVFSSMDEMMKFSRERLWELEKPFFKFGGNPAEPFFNKGWLVGVVQYARREDMILSLENWDFDWNEFRVVEVR